jgi:hypothetical protein
LPQGIVSIPHRLVSLLGRNTSSSGQLRCIKAAMVRSSGSAEIKHCRNASSHEPRGECDHALPAVPGYGHELEHPASVRDSPPLPCVGPCEHRPAVNGHMPMIPMIVGSSWLLAPQEPSEDPLAELEGLGHRSARAFYRGIDLPPCPHMLFRPEEVERRSG